MSDHAFNSGPVAAADLIQKVLETAKAALPESIANDVRDNLKAAIQDAMAGLDVVTREEFEVQKAVLAKTRAKLDQLETKVAVLESEFTEK